MRVVRTAGMVWIVALAMTPLAWGQEWTRFRGPNGSGVSDAKGIPASWTEKDYQWKVELPASGHSSPVIWGDKIFLSGAIDATAERKIFAISVKDGKNLWTKSYPSVVHKKHGLNSFASPIGEKQLADAFQRFAAAGATELVVDLRYNGGGYIDIASELGYMVAGQIQTSGKIFESLVYNDKRTSSNNSIPFASTITGFFGNSPVGQPFAALNLRRVYVLSTGSTCSASESFISGLRGIDVEVIQIGGTTCGKPYGFSQTNNCTLSYFALEFEGRNNKGVVTPVTGITPTCAANDDFNHALGDPAERLLATALKYQATGACVAIAAAPPLPLALSLSSAQRLGLAPQIGNALNADMEFMAKPAESAKLYRGAK